MNILILFFFCEKETWTYIGGRWWYNNGQTAICQPINDFDDATALEQFNKKTLSDRNI